jgi:hypothetical protein
VILENLSKFVGELGRLCVWQEIAGKILSSAHRGTVYLSKLPALDKKVRVAFDWTPDLLFPKDVCVVYQARPPP